MPLIQPVSKGWSTLSKAEKFTWLFWGLVTAFIFYKCISDPSGRTVVNNYLEAARFWIAGEPVYFGNHGFLYLPQFAFLVSFIAELPRWLAEVIERMVQLPLLLAGLFTFCRFIAREKEKSFFPLMTLVVFLISFSSFRNGQTNIATLGLMLLSIVALTSSQWNRAAVFMTLGIVFKPTFIVFYLLSGALHRPMYWRLPLGLLVAFLLPMLFASPGYVIDQHLGFIQTLVDAVELGVHKADWASFFGIFPQVMGVFVPEKFQTVVRLILAPVTLWLAWYAKKHYKPEMAAYYMYALPACYLMLFNPRNENNDYAILSAAIGFWLAAATHRYGSGVLKGFSWFILLGIIGAYEISVRLTPGMDAWVSPIMGTVFTLFLLMRLFLGRDERLPGK
ncbi:glycosyltransferase 87 family protein [Endozoicomonas sp. Mp262]|uniref:glycosyltransferase 87 family protein n=1 Tax=Endozoicomonas sp. Mp262 TaxID=2919499 RepID=UPI0021DB447F